MRNHLEGYLKHLANLSDQTALADSTDTQKNNEEADFENRAKNQALKHRDEKHKQNIENEQQNIKLRFDFAHKIYKLTLFVIVTTVVVILCSGVAHVNNKEFLSDQTLVALITFAGVDIVGLFAMIVTYLFSKGKTGGAL